MRLIDADALKEKLPPVFIEASCRDCPVVRGFVGLGNLINDAPTIDAAPVVHGKWFDGECDDGGELWYCSRCNYPVKTIAGRPAFDYCPHCGAKIDEEVSE